MALLSSKFQFFSSPLQLLLPLLQLNEIWEMLTISNCYAPLLSPVSDFN